MSYPAPSQIPSQHSRRITGWIMLLAYLVSFPGVLPGIVGALASFHGEHEVHVASSHIILCHGEAEHSHEEIEQHQSGASQTFAADQDQGADHVVCFSAHYSHGVAVPALVAPNSYSDALLEERVFAPECRIYPVPVHLQSVAPRPPPGKPAWLVGLRATVLVI